MSSSDNMKSNKPKDGKTKKLSRKGEECISAINAPHSIRKKDKETNTRRNSRYEKREDPKLQNKDSEQPQKKKRTRRRRRGRKNGKKKNQNQENDQYKHKFNSGNFMSSEEASRYISMDCEMVGVGPDGHRSALARVSIIDLNRTILLDSYVKVSEPITDYRTFVSGITAEHIESEYAIDYEHCRALVRDILRDRILIGHALKNDLHSLKITHPWHDIRDTAKYEPFQKCRFDDGILWPRKLKDLVEENLGRTIQPVGRQHCPIEDANAAMDLYLTVRNRWEKVMEYKMKKTMAILQEKTAVVENDEASTAETEETKSISSETESESLHLEQLEDDHETRVGSAVVIQVQ